MTYYKNTDGSEILIYNEEFKTGMFSRLIINDSMASTGIEITSMEEGEEIPDYMTQIEEAEYVEIRSNKFEAYWISTAIPQ